MNEKDLRVRRTKESIINAFIELRAKKPLEKITVKELADLAYINKATFYTHYHDIYDLEEQLEIETIQSLLKNIPHPEYILTNPKEGTIEMITAFSAQSHLLNILFSGSRQSHFHNLLESEIKSHIYEIYPKLKNNLKAEVILTILIQGNFYAYRNYADKNFDEVAEILGDISEYINQKYLTNSVSLKVFPYQFQ
jgi:AcrR family transcriptional regulator